MKVNIISNITKYFFTKKEKPVVKEKFCINCENYVEHDLNYLGQKQYFNEPHCKKSIKVNVDKVSGKKSWEIESCYDMRRYRSYGISCDSEAIYYKEKEEKNV